MWTAPQDDAWQSFSEVDGALDWPTIPGVDSAGNRGMFGRSESEEEK